MPAPLSERALIALLGSVQFMLLVGFMMVMPLGPDFAAALGIPAAKLGWIAGAYTAAAAVSGLLSSSILDRFDRRHALLLAACGMSLGHLAGAFAPDLTMLLASRVLAGAFGGPASALSMSIVVDAVAPQRRGRALGAIMGAFSLASVIGVPIGLQLAQWFDWRAPFIFVGASGLLLIAVLAARLPAQRAHLAHPRESGLLRLLRPLDMRIAYLTGMSGMIAGFLVIPNISAFIQLNLGYPRADIGMLYLVGGAISFFTTRLAGWMADRVGAVSTASLATVGLIASILIGYVFASGVPVMVFFALFMACNAMRNVSASSLTTAVPRAQERAGFMAISNATQHIALASGSFLSAQMLTNAADGRLLGMPQVAMLAASLAVAQPLLMSWLSHRLTARDAAASARDS